MVLPLHRALATSTGEPKQWPSVAIVGVGQLGAAVASNLIRNKVPLVLFDLHGDKNVPRELQEALTGATWATSAREAAAMSEVVITALPKPEHVTAAMSGEDGILAGIQPGATWIEHSTTDFENTTVLREQVLTLNPTLTLTLTLTLTVLWEQVEAKGAKAVEAPFTGGMQILREGKMVTFVGADPAVFDGIIENLVSLSAPRIVRCAPLMSPPLPSHAAPPHGPSLMPPLSQVWGLRACHNHQNLLQYSLCRA